MFVIKILGFMIYFALITAFVVLLFKNPPLGFMLGFIILLLAVFSEYYSSKKAK